MDEIKLAYSVPTEDVAEFVTLFYHFHADLPVFEDTERADHAQIRFRLSARHAEYRMADGSVQDAAEVHVIGPTSGAWKVRAEGPVEVFGMGLTPAGWAAMIGDDASTMMNRAIDATVLFGAARLRDATAALRANPDPASRVAIGEALVRDLVKTGDAGARRFVRQVDGWLAASPSPEMDVLVDLAGLSRRQVERKCKALYGVPPKLLARKYRALRAANAMLATSEPLDDALERGFYDQSHMIREVKQFTGLTPGQIKDEATMLSRMTITQRSALGGLVSPLISGT
ncbi:AraC family transcriptional regulator [Sphingomonas panacis]|uniref:AraC family transcriptional regulator n=1 Tax=Sphingomonas panacis TaxID=1560345 RepID=A0A1B3Z6D7_9SPHN|nr:helix-turn-helix domain-containing protein [Sphingomonas panacis]AOH82990.1 AraC family transcriptional regulator [Sphingomonas panacis]